MMKSGNKVNARVVAAFNALGIDRLLAGSF